MKIKMTINLLKFIEIIVLTLQKCTVHIQRHSNAVQVVVKVEEDVNISYSKERGEKGRRKGDQAGPADVEKSWGNSISSPYISFYIAGKLRTDASHQHR